MKKFSLLSNEQIRKHLANTSPAKVTHSFSKSKRFTKKDPQFDIIYSGARKPSTAVLLPSQTDPVALVSANDQISLTTR